MFGEDKADGGVCLFVPLLLRLVLGSIERGACGRASADDRAGRCGLRR